MTTRRSTTRTIRVPTRRGSIPVRIKVTTTVTTIRSRRPH